MAPPASPDEPGRRLVVWQRQARCALNTTKVSAVSATSLLVLGVIRMLQPVHGYDVRREIVSWRVDTLTTVKPGSIYAAIRTLEKDGSIAVHAREEGDRGAERTTYVLTGEGEKEFQTMLRQSWWKVSSPAEPLVPALTLMLFLPRRELIAALHARIGWLEGELAAGAFMRASIRTARPERTGPSPNTSARSSTSWPPAVAPSSTGPTPCASACRVVPTPSPASVTSRGLARPSAYGVGAVPNSQGQLNEI